MDSRAGGRRRGGSRKFYQGLIADFLEFAEREFELSLREADGATRREHAEQLERRLGRVPEELASLPCPEVLGYLWGYFQSMNARRSSNGYTINPLSHQEVTAWAQLSGVALDPLEADVLRQLEELYPAITRSTGA